MVARALRYPSVGQRRKREDHPGFLQGFPVSAGRVQNRMADTDCLLGTVTGTCGCGYSDTLYRKIKNDKTGETMSDLNDVKLFGRVVRDAETKTTTRGKSITLFSIAVKRDYKTESGAYEARPHFFPLTLYGEYGVKIQQYLKKGQKVIVTGYLKQERWEKDGNKRSSTAIGVNNIQLIFDSKSGNKPQENTPAQPDENDISSEDLAEFYQDEEEMFVSDEDAQQFDVF